MVEIRNLKPLVRIKMPQRPPVAQRYVRSQQVTVRRPLADHPPPTPQPTPCRLWQGRLDRHGYSVKWFRRRDGTRVQAGVHRWVMSVALDRDLEPWEHVMHLCDQPLCYRLSHLRLGTLAENNRDMFAKGRANVHPPLLTGSANGRSKLRPMQVAEIRRLYTEDKFSQRTIAEMYNIAPQTVSKIVTGLTWQGPPATWSNKRPPAGKGGC